MLEVFYPLADNVLCRTKLFCQTLQAEVTIHPTAEELLCGGYLIRQERSYAAIGTR